MSTFIERLEEEKDQLDEKTTKLDEFIHSEHFTKVAVVQASLLKVQLSTMHTYSDILEERLTDLNK